VLNTGNGLIADKHFAAPDIKHKMDELSNDWDDLMKQSANRRNHLDASLAKHKVKHTTDVTNDWLCTVFWRMMSKKKKVCLC